jgi:hypothetical protein
MAAVDAARGGRQFSAEDIDAPGAESPPRPTVSHSDKFSDQFAELVGPDGVGRHSVNPSANRHPHYVGKRSLHEYRTSPGSSQ